MGIISPKEAASRSGKDYLRNHRFEIILSGALAAGSNVTDQCKSAPLPGVSYATVDYRNGAPPMKLPYEAIYAPAVFTFYNSTDNAAWKHFQECANSKIANIDGEYSFNFLEDYAGNITVKHLDGKGSTVYQVEYINAYVSSLPDNILDMDNRDSINEFQVEFTYEYYKD